MTDTGAIHMKRTTVLFTCSILYTLAFASAAPLDDWERMKPIEPKGYVCGFATEAPAIDGKLDDKAWQAAPWTDQFVDIEADKKPRPRLGTRAKMLWDNEYFYV